MVCKGGGCIGRDVSGHVCVEMDQTTQGTSASEGHQAANVNGGRGGGVVVGGGGGGGGQNVDIVGLTCRSDGWAEGR